ncbi:MAG: acetyl-CoA acetyltransferase [Candidatus Thermoplasmatota archaeon]
MLEGVAIIGAGFTGARPDSPEVSYKELMFEAASKAYEDAGVSPRKDVGSFIGVSEDFWEGTSIFDEYIPDQIGGALRPVCTICNDGLQGIATGVMHIRSGIADIVVVEGHAKVSDVVNPQGIMHFGLDPLLLRPLGYNAHVLAGIEMKRYLHEAQITREDCARVVVKNRGNALLNLRAAYGAKLSLDDVLCAPPAYEPMGALEISNFADGACVLVLASERVAKNAENPIWITGIGWCNDTPNLGVRRWGYPRYVEFAAEQAYAQAGIRDPSAELDMVEVDDTYAYKELQHIEALGIAEPGEAADLLQDGTFEIGGRLPVNASGGSLGLGSLLDANGLVKTFEAVLQLRGMAGERQVSGAEQAAVQSWRGVPTTSAAVMVLSSENGGERVA